MKKAIVMIGVAMLLMTYAIALSLRETAAVPDTLDAKNHPGFYDYRGAINVQTSLTHGFLTPSETVRAAQESKLDFLIFTELNRFVPGGSPDGWQRQTLVLNGGKYSYLESRVLSMDPDRLKTSESLGQAQTTIADLLSRVGDRQRSAGSKDSLILGQVSRDGTEWAGAPPAGLAGLEVMNIRQAISRMWRDSRLSMLWSILIYPFNSDLALVRLFADFDTSFETWDRLSRERRVFGVLGTDAGLPSSVLGVTLRSPGYETLFTLATNHVLLRSELTGDTESDRTKLLAALTAGQTYFAFDVLGQTKGFATWYEDTGGIKSLGARVRFEEGGRVMVRLPKKPLVPFETVVYRDGLSIMTSNSTETEFRVLQGGVYRIVVRLFVSPSLFDGGRWIPWIITNPIVITARDHAGPSNQTIPRRPIQDSRHAKRTVRTVSRADN
ncbi:hypothetical protein BH10BDE1_BH10BDE1_21240 [soil metagenome]